MIGLPLTTPGLNEPNPRGIKGARPGKYSCLCSLRIGFVRATDKCDPVPLKPGRAGRGCQAVPTQKQDGGQRYAFAHPAALRGDWRLATTVIPGKEKSVQIVRILLVALTSVEFCLVISQVGGAHAERIGGQAALLPTHKMTASAKS
jgi:hypothetical protein